MKECDPTRKVRCKRTLKSSLLLKERTTKKYHCSSAAPVNIYGRNQVDESND